MNILSVLLGIFSVKKTPAELVKIRNINQNNDSSDNDLMLGVVNQYKQMHDSTIANKILRESLQSLKQVKYIDKKN